MRLLIAGYGELGQHIAREVLSSPERPRSDIMALRRHWPDAPGDPINDSIQWVKADLSDPDSLETIPKGITHVVFCAAPNERTEEAYRNTYLCGVQNLYRALQTQTQIQTTEPRWLMVSSTAVYSADLAGDVDELSQTDPKGFNGTILLETEQWLQAQDPSASVLRLSGIYGPSRVGLLNQLRTGTARVPASDDYWANRIHVQDAARAAVHLLSQDTLTGIYIGTDSSPRPLKDLYTALARLVGAPAPTTGPASPMMGKKRLSNKKLLATGFELQWPDCLDGYREILKETAPPNTST
jgi:nucleoside-diphosphate-sugar epimerase